MNLVIIGSGWLGKPLAAVLADAAHQVVSVYRKNVPDFNGQHITSVSMEQVPELERYLQKADGVIFCFPPPKEGKSHAQVCLELAALCSSDCRFIFTSTTGVYPDENRAFDEFSELDPSNRHFATETELRNALKERLIIVRLAGLIGEGRYPVRMMSRSGKSYNGNQYANLIHQEDAVGILRFLVEGGIRVPVVNACAPSHPPKGEYYTAMAEKLEIAPPLFEKGPTGKFIQSDLSIALGYQYLRPNPYDFY